MLRIPLQTALKELFRNAPGTPLRGSGGNLCTLGLTFR